MVFLIFSHSRTLIARFARKVIKRQSFGARNESLEKSTKTEFLGTDTSYVVSSGYIYPIFGAFRSLLKYDVINQEVSRLFDPLEVWNEVGVSIVQNTFETYTNPQLAGKDKQLWLSNYRIVETQSLRKLLSEAR